MKSLTEDSIKEPAKWQITEASERSQKTSSSPQSQTRVLHLSACLE